MVPALAFAAFGLTWTRHAVLRAVLVACSLLFALSLFLTQSRGGVVALAAMFGAAILLGASIRRHLVGLVLMVASVGVIYYGLFAAPEARERLVSPGRGSGRADLWSVATGMIGDHPILGVGAGNFTLVAPEYATETINLPDVHVVVDRPHVAHNTYLGVFSELGVIGLAAFVLLVVGSLGLAWRSEKLFRTVRDRELQMVSRALIVGLVGMLTAFVFLSGQYEKQLWLLLGLAVALHAVAQARAGPARG